MRVYLKEADMVTGAARDGALRSRRGLTLGRC